MENAIEIRSFCKAYSGFAVTDLNMSLPSGTILGLVGENGAGKSTVIKSILNIVRGDSGTITVLGQNSKSCPGAVKEEIGTVLDNVGFNDCFSAAKIGAIMSRMYKSWDAEGYNALLKRLSVPPDKKFKELSKGMKMKLAITVALSHNTKLLILDEATSGLDPVVRDEITDMLIDFTRDENHSVLISSHIVSDLEKVCDYIAFMHEGRLVLFEEKDKLINDYAFINCTAAELSAFNPGDVAGRRTGAYGTRAVVKRSALPHGCRISPVTLEELFVFMIRGNN